MGFAALLTWCGTVLLGLYMLTVWLIESDASASQLPAPVVFTHLALASAGLAIWVVYLIADQSALAWVAVGTLSVIALLGLAMFARWIPVYQGPEDTPAQAPLGQHAASSPPEGNFPIGVVACHGLLAAATYVLVLLTALDVGGS